MREIYDLINKLNDDQLIIISIFIIAILKERKYRSEKVV